MREQHRGTDLAPSVKDEHTLADREERVRATAARDDAASLLLHVVSSTPRDPRGILERRQISAGRTRRGATALDSGQEPTMSTAVWPQRRRIGSSDSNDAPADGSRRTPRLAGREDGFAGGISDELAALRGKNLGVCAVCGRPVFFAHAFTRSRGHLAHVRCPITAQTPAPMPSAPAVPARSVARVRSERA